MLTDSVLIDLDALLDRRIACANVVSPELANLMVTSPLYFSRVNDGLCKLFPGLPSDWHKADINKVKQCVAPTNITTMLADHAISCKVAAFQNIFSQELKVTVNCSGWEMDEEELSIMAATLKEALGCGKVEVVNLDEGYNSPINLKANHTVYITYDLDAWMTKYAYDLKAYPIPSVSIVAPYKQLTDLPSGTTHQMAVQATTVSLAPYITLNILPLEEFSLIKLK